MNCMYKLTDVQSKIANGQNLLLAGDESVLTKLPKGNWIGGSIPYFMAENGGMQNRELIYLTELPSYVSTVRFTKYTEGNIFEIYKDGEDNGFSLVIIPGSSSTHLSFALNAPNYPNFATRHLAGWIAGVHLNDIKKAAPKVFYGPTGEILEDGAVALHVGLPANKYADVNIINIFEQGDGPVITFPEDGFVIKEAMINGERCKFVDYLKKVGSDVRLPLVADYCGAMVNISFQEVDEETGEVSFYAPVFKGIRYKLAAPIDDYVAEFIKRIPKEDNDKIFFSCNCILNYLYSELEGKHTGNITGPITFGEIAYQLLNQTLAYISIHDL